MKNSASLIFLVGLVFAGFIEAQSRPAIWTIQIENIKGEEKTLYCEVAASDVEKRRGLMFRDKLLPDECMIFVYEKPVMLSFWMKNTYLPLSIAFVDEKQIIMELYDMKPHDENIISSTTPGIYALEVNRGWFRKNYIYQGSKIKINKKDGRDKKYPAIP